MSKESQSFVPYQEEETMVIEEIPVTYHPLSPSTPKLSDYNWFAEQWSLLQGDEPEETQSTTGFRL